MESNHHPESDPARLPEHPSRTKIVTKTEREARETARQFKSFGLGDAIAAVATPIARALHLPCIDPATKQLRPESGCAKRKAALNKAVPDISPLG